MYPCSLSPSLSCVVCDFLPSFIFFYFFSRLSFPAIISPSSTPPPSAHSPPRHHLSSPECVHFVHVHVSVHGGRLHRCCRLWHVGVWCRWVGVTLKMFPASLTQSLSSTRTCQYVLHRCVSTVGVSVCAVLDVCVPGVFQNGSLLRPSSYLGRERKQHRRTKSKLKKRATEIHQRPTC